MKQDEGKLANGTDTTKFKVSRSHKVEDMCFQDRWQSRVKGSGHPTSLSMVLFSSDVCQLNVSVSVSKTCQCRSSLSSRVVDIGRKHILS